MTHSVLMHAQRTAGTVGLTLLALAFVVVSLVAANPRPSEAETCFPYGAQRLVYSQPIDFWTYYPDGSVQHDLGDEYSPKICGIGGEWDPNGANCYIYTSYFWDPQGNPSSWLVNTC